MQTETETSDKMKSKLGNWILDVAKYITTVGLIAPFLSSVTSWYAYVFMAIVVIVMVSAGIYMTRESTNNK